VSAAEWWFLLAVAAATVAALTAIAGLGPTGDRVARALGHAAVALLAAGVWVAVT
jgi:hypothetical protein